MAICQTNEHIVGHFICLCLSNRFLSLFLFYLFCPCLHSHCSVCEPYCRAAFRHKAACYICKSHCTYLFMVASDCSSFYMSAKSWNIATAELDIFAHFICILLLHWFLHYVLFTFLLHSEISSHKLFTFIVHFLVLNSHWESVCVCVCSVLV